jgi:hypothetical protein
MENLQWIVALFSGNGATDVIRKANDAELRTFYPIRFNGRGEPVPMWRNYLFVEFRDILTLQICRSTNKFLNVISMRNKEGDLEPVLLPKNTINEQLELALAGKFNERLLFRRFYGKGSFVRVIDGNFIDKRVRLEVDVSPGMNGNKKVAIDINGYKGYIEVWKLAL